jgi:hypothetical protein
LLCLAGESDLLTLCVTVLLDVRLGTLEDDLALLLVGLYIALALRPCKRCRNNKQEDGSTVVQSRKMVNNTTASTCLVARWVCIIIVVVRLLSAVWKMVTYSLLLLSIGSPGLTGLLLGLALLQESLGNENIILGGDFAVGTRCQKRLWYEMIVQEEKCSRRIAFSTGKGDSMVHI